MQDFDPAQHPAVQAIDGAIEALTYLREGGVKRVPLDPAVWRALAAASREAPAPMPAPAAATAHPAAPAAPLPPVPAPSQAEQAQAAGDTPEQRRADLNLLEADVAACRACAQCAGQKLAGEGDCWNPPVAIVNGACLSGDTEVARGSRLEGKAGELLDKMFAAIGLSRAALYVTPAAKCPVAGRPSDTLLRTCSKHLQAELRLVRPRAIVLLGPVAAKALFPSGMAATGKVGQWHRFDGRIPAVVLHHPMRLLLLDETLARPLKLENWAALQALKTRILKG